MAERVRYQLVGMDDPQIPRDPLEFMLSLHFMTDAEYNSWGNGISYVEWFLEGLNYDELNITRFIPSLIVQVYAQTLVLLLFFFFFFLS